MELEWAVQSVLMTTFIASCCDVSLLLPTVVLSDT